MRAFPRGPMPASCTLIVAVLPGVNGPPVTPMMKGKTPMKLKFTRARAVSPLSIFVTWMVPPLFAQGVARGLVRARICVPETRSVCAGIPPTMTSTGSSNPIPSIVTSVPPSAVPVSGRAPVICIFGV